VKLGVMNRKQQAEHTRMRQNQSTPSKLRVWWFSLKANVHSLSIIKPDTPSRNWLSPI